MLPKKPFSRFVKRLFDIIVAGVALILTAPLMLLVALLIKSDSAGPLFFRQWRLGRGQRPFRIIKFRTMVDGAEEQGPAISVHEDDRVTRLGQFLRRCHVDELPNLLNVLKGDMSIVGPRPELLKFLPHYSDEQKQVFQVRPGLTDPASLKFRREATLLAEADEPEQFYLNHILPKKLELNLKYVQRQSLRYDSLIISKTLAVIAFDLVRPGSLKRLLMPLLAYRRPIIQIAHLALFAISFVWAFLLRFDLDLSPTMWKLMITSLPFVLLIRGLVFSWSHLYQGLWRYVSVWDMFAILKAVTLSSLIFTAFVLLFFGHGFPRSVLVIDWLLCLALVGGVRMSRRIVQEFIRTYSEPEAVTAVIVGAGDAGEMLLREIDHDQALDYRVVGFLDDERRFKGHRIRGIEVLGRIDELPHFCRSEKVEEVLIAIPSAGRELEKRVAELCRQCDVIPKRVPGLTELLEGKARIGQLEPVKPEDLLGRKAVRLETGRVRKELRGKRVLVTGGAGSIGSELARQVAPFEPQTLVLLDRGESSLYFAGLELAAAFPRTKVLPVVGDILDRHFVEELFEKHRPQIIYHAAAYKHVPLMEEQPLEAIQNNLFGTEMVALAAQDVGVEKFVFISTDKAVNPIGIMGMTKLAAERLLLSLRGGPTTFTTVRFGNVLGSNGSVLPLFQRQIAQGGPITVTDPEATRFFMLTSEAVQLVLQAGAMGKAAEIFFLDMGQPIRIMDMAHNLIRLYGLELERDVAVEVIGLRQGERLEEELVTEVEELLPSEHEKIFVVQHRCFDGRVFRSQLESLRGAVSQRERESAVRSLRALIAQHQTAGEPLFSESNQSKPEHAS